MVPARQDLWDMPRWAYTAHWAVVLLCGVLVVYGLWRHIRLWRMGRPAARTDKLGSRIGGLLFYGLGQRRVLAQAYPGLMHGLIFYGFLTFLVATSLVGVDMEFRRILLGDFYLGFELVLNSVLLLYVIGLSLAAFRRYLLRPDRLNIRGSDATVLGMLAFIACTGFSLEVMRLRGMHPPWAEYSWLGSRVASLFGPPPAHPTPVYPYIWWTHQLTVFTLISTLSLTKFKHIVLSPTNLFFRRLTPPGALSKIENIEETKEPLGAGSIEQLSWKQLLDGDACTECGRCQAACPAYAAHQPLSPKKLVMDFRDRMYEYPGALWSWQKPILKRLPFLMPLALGSRQPAEKELVGEVIHDDTLWSCTTCRACERECPVLIEHVSEIVDMRRHLTLEEGRIPDTLASTLRNAERQANPWGQPRYSRAAWAQGLGVPLMADVGHADVLYWVGCAGSYDPRNQKVSKALVQIMQAAGVEFAILGEEERCHAEWARRAGEEYLYQTQAQANVETLQQYRFDRIVTQCPHCYNTLKNEYPQFGGRWPVIHHSQLIEELLQSGRLTVNRPWAGGRVTFHDSCYLGRYNQVYEPPRKVLTAVPGLKLAEMRRSRQRGFCCGGGGANVWMEHEAGKRVNFVRMDEIAGLDPTMAATACPFCMIMLTEAATARSADSPLPIQDIAEVVAGAL